MKLPSKLGLAAGLGVLALAAPASAAPVTVNMRIEGPTRTLFEGPVTTDVRPFHFTGGAEFACDAGTGAVTRGAVVVAAADTTPFVTSGTWFAGLGPSFAAIDAENVAFDAASGRYLIEYKNEQAAMLGACNDPVQDGDRVLFAYARDTDPLLKLSGPASATSGASVTLSVADAVTGAAVTGATVAPPGSTADAPKTGGDGTVAVTVSGPGVARFKATKSETVPSAALSIAVGAPTGSRGGASGGSVAPDRAAPAARVLGIGDHQVFAKGKGPRTLRATAPDPSGLAAVKLRLTRRAGGRCAYFSGRRAAFVPTRCGRAFSFKVGTEPSVSYLLPARLGPGRYLLDLTAVDRAGNRTALARGSTRVVFTVR